MELSSEAQKKLMESVTKVSHTLPGGRGSGKKAHPLFMKQLIKEHFPSSILNQRGKIRILIFY